MKNKFEILEKVDWNVLNEYIDNGLIMANKHPEYDIWILNYSPKAQSKKFWDIYTMSCRGMIIDANGEILARPFQKFKNFEEHDPSEIDMSQEFDIFEKMDGCCHEDTVIITKNGKKTIKEICESKNIDKILSFNINKECFEFKKIIGTSILENNNNWYEVEIENGETIKLTGNHKIWIPSLSCYRRVDELNGDEDILFFEKTDNLPY
jgi:hypothetical protein